MSDEQRPKFGSRFLVNEDNVFKHNAWDDVEWSEDQLKEAKDAVERNSTEKLGREQRDVYEKEASNFWNKFYGIHDNRFFKDRNWLFTELPELKDLEFGSRAVLEIGCGAGNTVYPILQTITNPDLNVFCCDFSPKAVELVKTNSEFDENRCYPFQCDVTNAPSWKNNSPEKLTPESLDLVLMIFTLSAMTLEGMDVAIENAAKLLKPGGIIFFRDYGQFDLAQLRFKKGKCLEDNFYVRGDGTRCYFFSPEKTSNLFLQQNEKNLNFKLVEKELKVDKRLQVNRGKQLKMYRVWIQAKYVKE